jgi:hypothetical protein
VDYVNREICHTEDERPREIKPDDPEHVVPKETERKEEEDESSLKTVV